MSEKKYRYSEIFGQTFQGEGQYTGRPTAWLRVWGCNFSCMGFSQSHLPRDQWVDPYEYVKVEDYKSMEELPVFPVGCDSGYSWAKKFSALARQGTATEICERIEEVLPGGKFLHPKSKQWHHMAFTGGEPMMSQTAIVDIMERFAERDNTPHFVTIETNGTQKVRPAFENLFASHDGELFWSVSPKLSASGEAKVQAIKPEVVAQYKALSNHGQLKFVVDGSDQVWEEVESAVAEYRSAGIEWDVWIMPVGADMETQESHQAKIAEQAVARGYSVAIRVHTLVFGNVVGK